MKVLIAAIGGAGDIHPFIAVGITLKARGHEVRMLMNPYFERHVHHAGLEHVPLGPWFDLKRIEEMPELNHPRKGPGLTLKKFILPNMPVVIDAVDTAIDAVRPDVVLSHHTCHGARWACERRRIPCAMAVLAPLAWFSDGDPSVFQAWEPQDPPAWYLWCRSRIARWLLRRMIDRPFNEVRHRCGFPPQRDLYLGDVRGGVVNLALWSRHFRGPLPGDPPKGRICGFPWFDRDPEREYSADEIEQFLADGEPPIIFTLGTSVVHMPGHFYEHAAEACRLLGRRGMLLTRHQEYAPKDLPRGVRVFTYAPFSTVLPRGCATVHHGGIGTTAQAMRAGRPTVIVPVAHDQFDNAARARRLGVSATLDRKKLSPNTLAAALRRTIEDAETAHRAGELGEKLSGENGGVTAAETLEETVRTLQ